LRLQTRLVLAAADEDQVSAGDLVLDRDEGLEHARLQALWFHPRDHAEERGLLGDAPTFAQRSGCLGSAGREQVRVDAARDRADPRWGKAGGDQGACVAPGADHDSIGAAQEGVADRKASWREIDPAMGFANEAKILSRLSAAAHSPERQRVVVGESCVEQIGRAFADPGCERARVAKQIGESDFSREAEAGDPRQAGALKVAREILAFADPIASEAGVDAARAQEGAERDQSLNGPGARRART